MLQIVPYLWGGGGLRFLDVCTQEGGGGVIQMRTECDRGVGGV